MLDRCVLDSNNRQVLLGLCWRGCREWLSRGQIWHNCHCAGIDRALTSCRARHDQRHAGLQRGGSDGDCLRDLRLWSDRHGKVCAAGVSDRQDIAGKLADRSNQATEIARSRSVCAAELTSKLTGAGRAGAPRLAETGIVCARSPAWKLSAASAIRDADSCGGVGIIGAGDKDGDERSLFQRTGRYSGLARKAGGA